MLLAVSAVEQAAVAQSAPNPAASPTPAPVATSKPFTVSGFERAYDFTRQNASAYHSTKGMLNQQSLEFGTSLHLGYRFSNSGFSIGATYLYANPLNGCADPALTKPGSSDLKCQVLPTQPLTSPYINHLDPDNTLPGYQLSSFYETYLEYDKNGLYAKIGDQVINTPWANASDSRIMPVAFQGADISYQLNPHYAVEVMDIDRWEPRTTSDWLQANLLTGAASELPYGNSPITNPNANSGGFQYSRIGYTRGNFVTNLHYYHFIDTANFAWLDGKYTFSHAQFKPWIAIQAGDERNTGSSILGTINSQIYGAQIGVNVTRNLVFTASADVVPVKISNLPNGEACTASTATINPAQTYPNPSAGYLVGVNTPQCIANPNGSYSVVYGGLVSPYTFGYATDPLFTTSLTQGMADRDAPGSSEKLALTYTSPDKRLVLQASQAYYDYGITGAPDLTQETNGDAMYRFRKPGFGPYKGLLVRYRYGIRTDDHSSALNFPQGLPGVYFGGSPYFVYNRAQLEYDF
jgi:hypothetical protein